MSTLPELLPTISECEQGTPEWIQLRVGKVTASRIPAVLAKIQKGESAPRRNYRAEIVSETLTGLPADERYVTPEMRWGKEQEPRARAAYECQQDVIVDTVGFVIHPTNPRLGCSPDGFVGTDGLVQFKCVKTSTHFEYILAGVVPEEYVPQMLVEMACTGRAWCDFVSFDPRLPAELQLFVRRLYRDDAKIAEIETAVAVFLKETDALLARIHFAAAASQNCSEPLQDSQPKPAAPEPAPAPPKKPAPQPVRPTRQKPAAAASIFLTAKPKVEDYSCFDDYDTDKSIWLILESLRLHEEKQAKLLKAPTPVEVEAAKKKRRLLN
jgi:putative phage-type endonuclease